MVRKEFPALLTQMLRKNRCFSTLKDFMPIYTRLEEKGCVLGEGYPVLKALAEHPLDSMLMVDLSGVDIHVQIVVDRFCRFRSLEARGWTLEAQAWTLEAQAWTLEAVGVFRI